MARWLYFAFVLTLAACSTRQAPGPTLVIVELGDAAHVRVVAHVPGLSATDAGDCERLLTMHVLDSRGIEMLPMLGDYAVEGERITFVPRFALSEGRGYRAKLHCGESAVSAEHNVPAKRALAAPTVEAIYPSGDELPANLLKFYVRFSRPMREQAGVLDKIRLLDEGGSPVRAPWRRSEFWSADRCELTVRIHPGRVKQGISFGETYGPVLEAGRKYTLEIGAGVVADDGAATLEPLRRKFAAVAEDRTRPLPEQWTLSQPHSGTCEPLRVAFGEALDWRLARSCLSVTDTEGRELECEITVLEGERGVELRPGENWEGGEYTLCVAGVLEDLAGNTPLRLFETRAGEPENTLPLLTRKFGATQSARN